mmetsp:Transcript_22734/g.57718  ORF Transcript_22734/g.57718 Transcript_22734/m.57718 type:complete len:248 (-) Transcript_22734:1647-2390(-)
MGSAYTGPRDCKVKKRRSGMRNSATFPSPTARKVTSSTPKLTEPQARKPIRGISCQLLIAGALLIAEGSADCFSRRSRSPFLRLDAAELPSGSSSGAGPSRTALISTCACCVLSLSGTTTISKGEPSVQPHPPRARKWQAMETGAMTSAANPKRTRPISHGPRFDATDFVITAPTTSNTTLTTASAYPLACALAVARAPAGMGDTCGPEAAPSCTPRASSTSASPPPDLAGMRSSATSSTPKTVTAM